MQYNARTVYTGMERNKKRESEEEMEKGRRIDRDASEVLRRNSVIIRGGRDRPGKIIFRWEGNQFHDRIGESSIRTEAGARKCNGKWIKFQRMFLFRVSRLERTLLHRRLWLFSSCSVIRNKSIRRNILFYNYNTLFKIVIILISCLFYNYEMIGLLTLLVNFFIMKLIFHLWIFIFLLIYSFYYILHHVFHFWNIIYIIFKMKFLNRFHYL